MTVESALRTLHLAAEIIQLLGTSTLPSEEKLAALDMAKLAVSASGYSISSLEDGEN